ncbi:cytoplasmic pattern recognition receptor signaling pathway in response to virus [Branchiostoma belcheri]|nr:cytoplasmic pattern recognition receptor signaling pathway in response to virus [Branchiostoma belcheri]
MRLTVNYGELCQGKRDRGAPRKRFKDQLKRQLIAAGTPKCLESSDQRSSCEMGKSQERGSRGKEKAMKGCSHSADSSSDLHMPVLPEDLQAAGWVARGHPVRRQKMDYAYMRGHPNNYPFRCDVWNWSLLPHKTANFLLTSWTCAFGDISTLLSAQRNEHAGSVMMEIVRIVVYVRQRRYTQGHMLGDPLTIYPSIDDYTAMVVQLGRSSLLYKRDLRRACRQIYVLEISTSSVSDGTALVTPMWRSRSAFLCQRITNAVTHLHREAGFSSVNYLDDFGGADSGREPRPRFTLQLCFQSHNNNDISTAADTEPHPAQALQSADDRRIPIISIRSDIWRGTKFEAPPPKYEAPPPDT